MAELPSALFLLLLLLHALLAVSAARVGDDAIADCSWVPDKVDEGEKLDVVRNVFVRSLRKADKVSRTTSLVLSVIQADLTHVYADSHDFYAAMLVSDPPEYVSYVEPDATPGVTQMTSLRTYAGSASAVFDGFRLPSHEDNLDVCALLFAGVNSTTALSSLGGVNVASSSSGGEAIRIRYFIMDPDTNLWAAYDDYFPVAQSHMSGGAVAAIVLAVLAVAGVLGYVGFVQWRKRRFRRGTVTQSSANTSFAPYQMAE